MKPEEKLEYQTLASEVGKFMVKLGMICVSVRKRILFNSLCYLEKYYSFWGNFFLIVFLIFYKTKFK